MNSEPDHRNRASMLVALPWAPEEGGRVRPSSVCPNICQQEGKKMRFRSINVPGALWSPNRGGELGHIGFG